MQGASSGWRTAASCGSCMALQVGSLQALPSMKQRAAADRAACIKSRRRASCPTALTSHGCQEQRARQRAAGALGVLLLQPLSNEGHGAHRQRKQNVVAAKEEWWTETTREREQ